MSGRPLIVGRHPKPVDGNVVPLDAESDPWAEVIALVDEQAEDEGLWFQAETMPEAYLQQELRRLHAAIESVERDSADG